MTYSVYLQHRVKRSKFSALPCRLYHKLTGINW